MWERETQRTRQKERVEQGEHGCFYADKISYSKGQKSDLEVIIVTNTEINQITPAAVTLSGLIKAN